MAFHRIQRFQKDCNGVAAIEFALVAIPLFMTLFVILECAMQYFVGASIDLAVQRTARQIRTGQVQEQALDRTQFKAMVCKQITDLFGCPSRLKIKIEVIKNIAATASSDPIDSGGNLVVDETFDIGKSGDFLLVQAFFPWPAFTPIVTLASQKTKAGEYVLRSSTLFRNEPF